MSNFRFNHRLVVKSLVAAAALAALAGIAGTQLAPQLPLSSLLLYSVLGAAMLLAILTAGIVASFTLWQFVLRKGGTDTQWLWFSSEPAGLVRLRQRSTAQSRKIRR